MRLAIAAAVVSLSAVPSTAGYLVDFGTGDHMVVDSYWEDGDRVHLMRDGVDLTVPRARIRRLQPDAGAAAPPAAKHAVAATPARRQESREELEKRQRQVEHHLLRVQQERFEAKNRGEPTERLGRAFQHAQEKRRALVEQLAH